jgi:hypothetical protein
MKILISLNKFNVKIEISIEQQIFTEINDRIVWQFFILEFYFEIWTNWYSIINSIHMRKEKPKNNYPKITLNFWTSFENDQIKYCDIREKVN